MINEHDFLIWAITKYDMEYILKNFNTVMQEYLKDGDSHETEKTNNEGN